MPGKRPATKLSPEKSSDDELDDSPGIVTPSRAFEDCDDAAGSKEVEATSAALALVLEVEVRGDEVRVEV
jgi:hypothetical protein